jgi:hypothetical protein
MEKSHLVIIWLLNILFYFIHFILFFFFVSQTPQGILASQAILRAFSVEFPTDIYVSPVAKVFIFVLI